MADTKKKDIKYTKQYVGSKASFPSSMEKENENLSLPEKKEEILLISMTKGPISQQQQQQQKTKSTRQYTNATKTLLCNVFGRSVGSNKCSRYGHGGRCWCLHDDFHL